MKSRHFNISLCLLSRCLIFLLCTFSFVSSPKVQAQCSGSYVYSTLNWDNLDYVWNSGGNGPYENYISNSLEQTQRFAIGRNWLSIVTSSAALVNPGSGNSAENTTHTGDVTGFTGADVQYNPTADGQTITITFNAQVQNASFALYDIDRSARIDVDAYNSANLAQNVSVATFASTILTTTNNNNIDTYVTASSTDLTDNSSNLGTATFTINNLINRIVITVTAVGSNPVFWLSDINACVNNGTFPTNWHQQANNRPFVGPTQNMPDYFLVTPDNDVAYYLNPANGEARQLFQDVSKDFVNSLGYDPTNRYLYYISENSSLDATNRTLKRYDYNSETINHTFINNITTSLGIPTFSLGIESAGCAFYDGALYLGVEGGRYDPFGSSNDRTRESIVWRIDFDGSNNPTVAYQVVAFDHYTSNAVTSIHDWGDFLIRNGVLYNFNTARNSCGMSCYDYTESKFQHVNLISGQITNVYSNPNISPANRTTWNGQAGMTWTGSLYYFRPTSSGSTSEIGLYNEAGGIGTPTTITVVSGTAWPNASAGDASDPFRPKCDFGDAPASYDPYSDPATQSPAVHERSENIRLGATWDYEFFKRGVSGNNDVDDGISSIAFFQAGWNAGYVVQVSAYNNSGSPATLISWLDYNGNGVFDASEAITPITVPSSASSQNFWLYWPYTMNSFVNGQHTWLRVRITSQSAGMTTAHATGYFTNGEVEDYWVPVDDYPLSTRLIDFSALLKNKKVELKWNAAEETGIYGYDIERSTDNRNWAKLSSVPANGGNGIKSYQIEDENPAKGVSYYRIRIIESTGMSRFSDIKTVTFKASDIRFNISPNPASDRVQLSIETIAPDEAIIKFVDMQGRVLITTRKRITAGVNMLPIVLSDIFKSGTYLVQITVGDETVYKKFVVTK